MNVVTFFISNQILPNGKIKIVMQHEGTMVAQWLRHCATNQKVAGSIADGVIGIFH
jgi:hypothetical protein